MGHAQEAQINLGRAKLGDEHAAQLAQVQATLAVLASIEELCAQVEHLTDALKAGKPEHSGEAHY